MISTADAGLPAARGLLLVTEANWNVCVPPSRVSTARRLVMARALFEERVTLSWGTAGIVDSASVTEKIFTGVEGSHSSAGIALVVDSAETTLPAGPGITSISEAGTSRGAVPQG